MVSHETCLSILVLTEDSANAAHPTLANLLKHMLKQVDPALQTHKVAIEPSDDEQIRLVMRANSWNGKGHAAESARRTLCRTIAEELLRPGNHFVAVHVDGDRRWADRHASENLSRWKTLVEAPIRKLIAGRFPHRGEEQAADALRRLLVLSPFYSIEGWTYQNTTIAAARCCGAHLEEISRWGADRSALDEVYKPKDALPCLRGKHNLELSGRGYPADDVLGAGKSWFVTVWSMHNQTLRDALRSTWDIYP